MTGRGVGGLLGLMMGMAAMGAQVPVDGSLSSELGHLRSEIVEIEKGLLDSLKAQGEAKARIYKLRRLMALQKKERDLGKERMNRLEAFVVQLEQRRNHLKERIHGRQDGLRRLMILLHRSFVLPPSAFPLPDSEQFEGPKRRVLARLVSHGLVDLEALKADLADAEHLENRIDEEKQQLTFLLEEIKEQESLIEFHKKLQADILRKKYQERMKQLEDYRNLKTAEGGIEKLIEQFNARVEFEKLENIRKKVSTNLFHGEFVKFKGKLNWPVEGQVLSRFGRAFDPKSKLYVFKKGVKLSTAKNSPVRAVFDGKVAYVGELPQFGKVVILDHGAQYYSLVAGLGEFEHKTGDLVAAGDTVGLSSMGGDPVYFEIRSGNVPVNPMKWVSN